MKPSNPSDRDLVPFSQDDATYVGDGDDGCYYQSAEHEGKWYVTVVVDSDTGSFVDTLVRSDGPYDTEKEAEEAGRGAAVDWCVDNKVIFDE